MTVATRLKETMAALKGARASLDIYRQQERNTRELDQLNRAVLELRNIMQDLDRRIKSVEFEEPQYKGKQ